MKDDDTPTGSPAQSSRSVKQTAILNTKLNGINYVSQSVKQRSKQTEHQPDLQPNRVVGPASPFPVYLGTKTFKSVKADFYTNQINKKLTFVKRNKTSNPLGDQHRSFRQVQLQKLKRRGLQALGMESEILHLEVNL